MELQINYFAGIVVVKKCFMEIDAIKVDVRYDLYKANVYISQNFVIVNFQKLVFRKKRNRNG